MIGRPEYTLTLPSPVQPTGTTSYLANQMKKVYRRARWAWQIRCLGSKLLRDRILAR